MPASSGPIIGVVTDDTDTPQIVLTTADDLVQFPVRRASKSHVLRFTVGVPGRRGTVWRLWANKGTFDVYLASRHTAGEHKVSLHQSGDWRYQLVTPKTVFIPDPPEGRILHQWRRPRSDAVGWTHGVNIVLPDSDLLEIPDDLLDTKDVVWIDAPPSGHQVILEIHLVRPNRGLRDYSGDLADGAQVVVVGGLALSNGEVVVVLAFVGPTTEQMAANIATARQKSLETPVPSQFDRSPSRGARMLVWGRTDEAVELYDLALAPEST